MKKAFIFLLTVLLLGSLAGCGGGGGGSTVTGATMTEQEVETHAIASATATQVAINTTDATGFLTLSSTNTVVVKSSGSFTAQCHIIPSLSQVVAFIQGLPWSATPDADGWYIATSTEGNTTFTFKVRYIIATKETQFSAVVTGGQDVVAYFSGTQDTAGLWNGNGYIIKNGGGVTSSFTTACVLPVARLDITYRGVDTTNKIFAVISMVAKINNQVVSEITAMYVASNIPPVHLIGYYIDPDSGTPVQVSVDRWVALP